MNASEPNVVRLAISGSFADIAVHPPLVDEFIMFLVFILPWGFFLWEMFRRCSPCYIIAQRERQEERETSQRTANDSIGSKLEAAAPLDKSDRKALYTEAQRQKDRQEEALIKKRAAAAVANAR